MKRSGVRSAVTLSAVVVSLVSGLHCSSSSSDAKTDPIEAKFKDQAVLVAPFDSTNPACSAVDPRELDRATFAACVTMDVDKLPADFQIVRDVDAFSPEKGIGSILVMPRGDENPAPWVALIGIGSVGAPQGDLTHPQQLVPAPAPPPLLAGSGTSLTASQAASQLGFHHADEASPLADLNGGTNPSKGLYSVIAHAADVLLPMKLMQTLGMLLNENASQPETNFERVNKEVSLANSQRVGCGDNDLGPNIVWKAKPAPITWQPCKPENQTSQCRGMHPVDWSERWRFSNWFSGECSCQPNPNNQWDYRWNCAAVPLRFGGIDGCAPGSF